MPAAQNIALQNSYARFYNASGKDVMHAGEPQSAYSWHTTSTVRYYASDTERELVGEKITDLTYIQSSNGLVAAVKTTGSKHDAMLLATDHLGSIIGVWDASGTLLEEHRYNAWGLRTSSTATPRLRRGFTGHEHLQQFGLIDMQARLYDPHLGRFLAPDPYVQAPDNHQSLNRYIYCMNNPLKYVDPDGEFWHIVIGAAVGGLVNWISNGCEFSWKGLAYFGVGAAVGAASAAVGGWAAGTFNVSGILPGAAVGAAVGGITGGASSFALNGGNNLIAGNNFFDNWWSATKSGLISGAITGGIDGGIRGGKLALQRDRNAWWGTEKKHGRGNWSFFNSEKPHTVVDFDFKSVHSNMDNACVPESLTELEQHFGGTKSFDEFATECGYIPNKGTPSHMVPISINNNFDALYYDGIHIADILQNHTQMTNVASEGHMITLHIGKYKNNMAHLDNIRRIKFYSDKIKIKLRVGTHSLKWIQDKSTVGYIVKALKSR